MQSAVLFPSLMRFVIVRSSSALSLCLTSLAFRILLYRKGLLNFLLGSVGRPTFIVCSAVKATFRSVSVRRTPIGDPAPNGIDRVYPIFNYISAEHWSPALAVSQPGDVAITLGQTAFRPLVRLSSVSAAQACCPLQLEGRQQSRRSLVR